MTCMWPPETHDGHEIGTKMKIITFSHSNDPHAPLTWASYSWIWWFLKKWLTILKTTRGIMWVWLVGDERGWKGGYGGGELEQ